ncbi:hypothetical protein A2334_03555 [Candidatus Roizmanbacteria bacterium RIFOXYB2_FULL_38_10]|uniref:OmpR/PhoB-type domain-containing protein n=1 Tax=Candidatus Roizmanbacteria bacterium RIFOXYD1_FULL_38_12 TaxID=1802093 RepID=A0A1F7L0X6_9BACT|nr:MAG: hypothetical protein A3K47_03290 [Candidatus Roizmanbacteria bacterium RIFOXYA2_FULL_38_14]OGK63789.1 MAG: hypothetical protein A3K27_03290 [Candidatus Roizmanbacteria bacterium RIFOXYA1_FULL_37_12]OGK65635.1 MAG: hypothetical protein A3K38_03290 [Candidatus Roizmanbacteria bacterium RIFOXYB1_FULL_40_23]OGK67477.1 MAG: hypothetical protein A2334_03555 [Candidatus Roizmanbacteria bacterium RIFOXYB2_FULL_38_10]OGK70040.1 MAG: hypothetical protein A3K21_03295 [Candidatus Roizmanbacteria ba
MIKVEEELQDNPLVVITKGLRSIRRVALAIKNTKKPEDDIVPYGTLSFNPVNGYLTYGTLKPIQMREHNTPFKLMSMLFNEPGKEVTYVEIAQKFTIKFESKKDKKKLREKFRLVIRQIRRRFGINRDKNQGNDIFILSGKGIKLAYVK